LYIDKTGLTGLYDIKLETISSAFRVRITSKIDVSNIIPKRLGAYLLGLIPGMVFELTVAVGDPMIAPTTVLRRAYLLALHAN
jgi:hypothetical protein